MTIPNTKTALRSLGLKSLIEAGHQLEIDGAEEMTKSRLIDAILAAQEAQGTGGGEDETTTEETTPAEEPKTEETSTPPEQDPEETTEFQTKAEGDPELPTAAPEAEKPKAEKPKAEKPKAEKPKAEKPKKEPSNNVLTIPDTPKWLTQMTTWVYVILPGGEVEAEERVTTTALLRAFGVACRHAGVEPREQAYAEFSRALKNDGIAKIDAGEGEGAENVTVLRMRAV